MTLEKEQKNEPIPVQYKFGMRGGGKVNVYDANVYDQRGYKLGDWIKTADRGTLRVAECFWHSNWNCTVLLG